MPLSGLTLADRVPSFSSRCNKLFFGFARCILAHADMITGYTELLQEMV
jgi:hypothetical protein